MSLEKLCRIFHISDLHLVTPETQKKIMGTTHLGTRALRLIASQGLAPHDPQTLSELHDAIVAAAEADPGWQTFIVATGDLSTWGDEASVTTARRFITKLAEHTGAKQHLVLFGNHDAWPGEEPWFPLFAKAGQISIATQRAIQIVGAYSTLSHASEVTVDFHRLNTVISDRLLNSAAYGQFDEASFARLRAERAESECVGVALTHHPVHDVRMSGLPTTLLNSFDAASAMRCADGPRIRLVLSGHRHVQNPAPGDLGDALDRGQPPLTQQQVVQLTAGTASQRPESSGAADNSFQMLRLGLDGNTLMVERSSFVQPNGIGSFVQLGRGDRVSDVCLISIGGDIVG